MSFPWNPCDPTRLIHPGGNYTTGLQENELILAREYLVAGRWGKTWGQRVLCPHMNTSRNRQLGHKQLNLNPAVVALALRSRVIGNGLGLAGTLGFNPALANVLF